MAWNLDRSATLAGDSTEDATRQLSSSGKLVWALMLSGSGAESHRLVCFDAYKAHASFGDIADDLVTTKTATLDIVADHPYVGSIATILAEGDVCYAGDVEARWATSSTTFGSVRTFTSHGAYGTTINCPVRMNSNLVCDNGKLWMASYDISELGQQTLYSYDLTTFEWLSTPIPTKHQSAPRFLSRDHNGHILVCDYNGLSITKYTNTGVFVSTTRLAASAAGANRQPNFVTLGDDRAVYIASFQGMISKFNPTTNAVTSYSNGLGDVHSFVDDGTYLWVAAEKRPMSVTYNGDVYTCFKSHMAGPAFDQMMWQQGGDGTSGAWTSGSYYVDDKEDLVRITKANQTIRHFTSEDRDIAIQSPSGIDLGGDKVNSVLVTPSFVCSTEDGYVTVPQYIWAITEANAVVAFPNSAMWRPNFYQMNGVAMMSFGQHDYIGE